MPKIEEPLSNDCIWERRQPQGGDYSVLSNDSSSGTGNRNIFRSDSNSSLESFASAVSSLNDSVYSAEEGSWNYIEGDRPSKIDNQVYQALQNVEIDTEKFKRIHTWKLLMETTNPEERSRWLRARPFGKLQQQEIPILSFDMDD